MNKKIEEIKISDVQEPVSNNVDFTKEEITESLKKANQSGFSIDLSEIESKVFSKREKKILIRQYFKKQFINDLFKILWASFVITITFEFFVNSTGKTGNFSFGLGTICKFIAILTTNDTAAQSSFFFVYFLLFNIPFLIFGYLKLGKKFTCLTLLYIMLQLIFDQILQHLPFVNPTSFHLIVDYLSIISNSPWVGSIYLFIFSAVAGILLGYSYSIIYRVGASTGGTDFITFYFSIKKNKPIGSIARTINIIILIVVIILNSLIMNCNEIPVQQRYSVLSQYDLASAHQYILSNNDGLQSLFDSIVHFCGIDDGQTIKTDAAWDDLIKTACISGYGSQLTGLINFKIKVFFVLGPTLFSSLTGVVVQTVCINWKYPRYKVRTYIITTNEYTKIIDLLNEKGYKNDIVSWIVNKENKEINVERKCIILSMLVLNWKRIEKKVFMVDPEVRITSLKTASVKGFFSLETDSDEEEQKKEIKREISSNEEEMQRIKKYALWMSEKERNKTVSKHKAPNSRNKIDKNK